MRKKILIILVVSVIYILFFPIFKNEVLDARYVISIEVLAGASGQSRGSEVWIDAIRKDGEIINLAEVPLDGNWENRGRLFHAGEENELWEIVVRSKNTTTITFITHPYSGRVRITDYKGRVQELDLYSEKEGTVEYRLEY